MDTTPSNRTQIQTASGLNFLVGIWLFISAFAVYSGNPMVTNNVLCGIVVTTLAGVRAFGAPEQAWMSWLNGLLGIWVIVSPWAIMGAPGAAGPTHGMIINNCITGGVILLLAVWSAIATHTQTDRTGSVPTVPRTSYSQ